MLAANHQSFCDSFFIPLVVRRKVTFLAKAEYFDSKDELLRQILIDACLLYTSRGCR